MGNLNVLVLGVGGNVSMGILKALRGADFDLRIVGACVSESSLGLFQSDVAYISPYANEKEFIPWVIDVCQKEEINVIYSGVEENVYALQQNIETLKKSTNAVFVASDVEVLNIGADKLSTANWLKENSLNYPKTANCEVAKEVSDLIQECGFPLILKPRIGKGSIGIKKVNSSSDLEAVNLEGYCLQEYVGDESSEYTCATYTNKEGGLEDIMIFRRELKYGTTFYAEIIQNEVIKEECKKICNALNPRGPLNIQLRLHNGKPICFELNIRFSGTSAIRAHFGYNDVAALVNEYVFNKPAADYLNPQAEGKAYRYFEEMFIDPKKQEKLALEGKA